MKAKRKKRKKAKPKPKSSRPNSISNRVARLVRSFSYIPFDILSDFARSPDGLPREKRRKDGRVRPFRFALTPEEKDERLREQDHRCKYCLLPFGVEVFQRSEPTRLKVTWDHFLPYSKFRDNSKDIIFACCQLCNNIKGDRVFDTPEDVTIHVWRRLVTKGFSLQRQVIV